MERQLWKSIVAILMQVDNSKYAARCDFSAATIVKVWFWAVIHDRPVSWACQSRNWAIWERKKPLPSNATMSRRLRTKEVQEIIQGLEARVTRRDQKDNIVWIIDGKPLTISGVSKDRQAGYGRATGGKAKGYKIHALIGSDGTLADWRLAPMNKDERTMAGRMLKNTDIAGYLLADGNYDSHSMNCATRTTICSWWPLVAADPAKDSATGNRPSDD